MTGWHIVWHYRDLRVEDHPALNKAATSGRVLPLFIYFPQEEGEWPRGSASKWWLHHSLKALAENYRKLGSRLVIRAGPAIEVFQQLASEIPIAAVYWNFRYEEALFRRDRQVAMALRAQGIFVHCFEGNYLISPSKFFSKKGKPYVVFTPFSKTIFASRSWRNPLQKPQIQGCSRIKTETVDALELLPKHRWADKLANRWNPGRKGGLACLKAFTKKVDAYAEKRDFPCAEGTSFLSPHLHFGEISPHEVWNTLENGTQNRTSFLRQLIWREFGNYFLFHFPSAANESWKKIFKKFPWNQDQKVLRLWQKGMTGYPIVDAGMRQLWQTGWMHNRVRMIVASFLVKDLRIHWIEGARWFWDTLVDADLANNTLGWQWVAGCGPDAAPYFRIFNPVLQGKKFDPDGVYVRQWIPELAEMPAKWIHSPWEAPQQPRTYPSPIVDHAVARQKFLQYTRCAN